MKSKIKAGIFCLLATSVSGVWAYTQSTHGQIADFATENSDINKSDSGILVRLGLGNSINDRNFLLPSSPSQFGYSSGATPKQLINQGVKDEDVGTRSRQHFYDPQQNGGEGLTILGQNFGVPSPSWALEDTKQIPEQDFSYADAQNYLYSALTSPAKSDRDKKLGLVFESLGHVIHHLEDMSQPQHVRNDIHCDATPFTLIIYLKKGCDTNIVTRLLYRPSGYESYVDELGSELSPLLSGYPTPDYGTFSTPRSFWQSGLNGNAEFTSNNFVSANTNFLLDMSSGSPSIISDPNHAFPQGSQASFTDKNINDPTLLGPLSASQPMAGDVSFVQTLVIDDYVNSFTSPNPYTSTLSIWYDSLVLSTGEVQATPKSGFTLNSLNYKAAAARLVPRAAAYSIGMLNYFFRGQISISLPSDGVYSVLDHSATNAAGQGFTKLKVNLQNTTIDGKAPDGTKYPQDMNGGTLVAVAKYYVNPCYQTDLTGEYTSDQYNPSLGRLPPITCSAQQYQSGVEQISQSAAIMGANLPANASGSSLYVFDFSAQPIPVNAHDLSIQVVYQGAVGSESNSLAIGYKNISEPTYVVAMNGTDYYCLKGTYYTPAHIHSTPSLQSQIPSGGQSIDPGPISNIHFFFNQGPVIATVPSLQPANYVRLAVLADNTSSIQLQFSGGFPPDNTAAGFVFSVSPNKVEYKFPPAYKPPVINDMHIFRATRFNFRVYYFETDGSCSGSTTDPATDALDLNAPIPSSGLMPVTLHF